jgi:DDE superfamily endonuclease
VHLQQEIFDFAEEHKDWLVIFHLPPYAPEINPQEGIWSLLKRALADFAAADLAHDPRHQTEAEEDPVPAALDHRLPATHRPGPPRPDRDTGHHGFNLSSICMLLQEVWARP